MFTTMKNKKVITIFYVFHKQICIYSVMNILQSNNKLKFKEVYFALAIKFCINIINERARTSYI